MDTAHPNRPFHEWLEDVRRIAEHNKDRLGHVPFWWACYRKNYSPLGAHGFNNSGMTVEAPPDRKGTLTQKPFPADPGPDIMNDLGLL